jgi:hypothetical protein
MATQGAKRLRAKELLSNAADTIDERSRTHGHYDLTLLRTSKLWADYLEREVDPMDVAICMALLKIARIMEARGAHDDNFVDLVSYAAIAGELAVKDWHDLDAY